MDDDNKAGILKPWKEPEIVDLDDGVEAIKMPAPGLFSEGFSTPSS